MHNVGVQAAPCFFGWHPYFRLRDDGIDACHLRLPARQVVCTNAKLIPLPGDDAFEPVAGHPSLDFRQPRAIGASMLDNGYADLQADADGRIRSHLRDPGSGLGIAMWQDSGVIGAFTGDSLAQGARRGIAVEPMQALTDAFNRADCVDAITLAPGAERIFRCGIEVPSA
jgi:aldose 1-epimerase